MVNTAVSAVVFVMFPFYLAVDIYPVGTCELNVLEYVATALYSVGTKLSPESPVAITVQLTFVNGRIYPSFEADCDT